jgi:hypothetical protein
LRTSTIYISIIRYSTATLALLSLSAIAQLHKQHQHQHQRHYKKCDIVQTAEREVVTKTLFMTTTICVDSNTILVLPTTLSTITSHNSTTSTVSTSATLGQFYKSPTSSPQVSSTSTSVALYNPSALSMFSVYVPPTVPISIYVVLVVVPTTTEALYVAPAAITALLSLGLSSSSTCSLESLCIEDLTFYQAGLRACGLTTDSNKEIAIAFLYDLIDTQSNGNLYCSKTVTILYKETNITAKVVDKCIGYTGYSIDLSNLALSSLGISFNQGQVTGIWYFND